MRKSFFSVVIPLFNKERYITRAIESVVAQDFSDFELIVVDDGSTDSSAEAAKCAIADLADAELICQLNQGAGRTRNTGLRRARGHWIAYLDADDMWQSNHLSELARITATCPEAKMIATNFWELFEGETAPRTEASDVTPSYCNYFLTASECIGRVNSSNVAIHADVPRISGEFGNARSGQDLEYWARIALDHRVALSRRKTSIYYRGNWGNMEQLASMATKGGKISRSISDVSPSLKLIESRWSEDPTLASRDDIRTYVNGRLDNAIRMQFIRKNFEALPAIRKMKFPSYSTRSRALSGLTYLPFPLLAAGHKLRLLVKESL